MTAFYHEETGVSLYRQPYSQPFIKLLVVTAYALWADSLDQIFKGFGRELELRVVLVSDDKQPQALAQAVETTDDIILVSSPGYLGSELNFVEALRKVGCQSPIMLLCSNYALPGLEDLQKLRIQGIVSLNTACLKELENDIYAVVDNQHGTLKEQYARVTRFYHRPAVQGLLSPFEKEILCLLSADLKDKEIAERLGTTDRTITYNLLKIYAKLGVSTRAGAVGEALSKGIISPYQVIAAKLSTKNL